MYIVDADNQERETEAIRHVVGTFHKDELLKAFGFDELAFLVVELQKPKLTPDTQGDVDILVGNLDFLDWADAQSAFLEVELQHPHLPHHLKTTLAGKTVSEANGLKWPPRPTRLVGVEVKCSYVTDDRLKAAKSAEGKIAGIRKQVNGLERMGLDMVGQLDIIGNEPAYKEDGGFLSGAARSARSFELAKEVLAGRLSPESKAAHFVWAAGSVGGRDESIRGAGTPQLLRQPGRNPFLEANDEGAISKRAAVDESIPKSLEHLSKPRYFPVVFIDCRKCSTIHYVDDAACPWNFR
jgi:hypothetical protein